MVNSMAEEKKLIWTIEDVLMQFNWMTKLTAEELKRFEEQAEQDAERELERSRAAIAARLRARERHRSEQQ